MSRTEIPGFYKEREGVFLNKDTDALRSYKRQKAQSKKMTEVIEEVKGIKEDLAELKTLIRELRSI